MLIKDQNNSHRSLLLIGPKILSKQFQIIVFIIFTRKIWFVLTFSFLRKKISFLNEQLLIKLCHNFSLNLVNL